LIDGAYIFDHPLILSEICRLGYNIQMDKKNIVVLGAGFGGLRAAMDLANGLVRMNILDRYTITLIDRSPLHVFIPLLYKVAAHPEPEHESNCSYDIATLVQGLPITFINAEITSPEITEGFITLGNGTTIHADYLVIALGSETNYFNIPGLKENTLHLKTLESSREIRAGVTAAFEKSGEIKIVIGGGGPNGIELAAELRSWTDRAESMDRGLNVTISIVEAMPTILPGFAPNIIATTMKRLAHLNISVLTDMKISSVSKDAIAVGDTVNPDALSLRFDVMIWTGGTKTPELLAPVPLEKEPRGKPMANHDMSCLSATPELKLTPMIYGIGDNVCFTDPRTQKPVPAIAHVAILEGAIAANNILEEIKKTLASDHTLQLKYFVPADYPYVFPVGENWAVAKIGPLTFSGWIGWKFSRLVELNYLLMIMPPWNAFKSWQRI
jgi:NADH dehydrogenase